MLIEHDHYKRNLKTGKIVRRQKVEVQCELCGSRRLSDFGDYCRKKLENDYCSACRNSLGINGCKGKKSKHNSTIIEKNCPFCHKAFKTYEKINASFCSRRCSEESKINTKYHKILNWKEEDLNKISLLIGIVLGDGTISGVETKKTKRIEIYSHSADEKYMNTIKSILSYFSVQFSISNNRENCLCIAFSLPNKLLEMLGLNFTGAKHRQQPRIPQRYCENINFALGLVLSDGYCCVRQKDGSKYISFSNTVKSISDDFRRCLDKNNIKYWIGQDAPSRYGKKSKVRYSTGILKQDTEVFLSKAMFLLDFNEVK